MKSLKRIIIWFFWGGLAGAIVGAIGGTMDRGSLFIMVPSGPLAWAILGAFVGSIGGAVIGAFWSLYSRIKTPSNHIKIEDPIEN